MIAENARRPTSKKIVAPGCPKNGFDRSGAVSTPGKITRFRLLSTSVTSLNVGEHLAGKFFGFWGHQKLETRRGGRVPRADLLAT
jgi:hypothetical protein